MPNRNRHRAPVDSTPETTKQAARGPQSDTPCAPSGGETARTLTARGRWPGRTFWLVVLLIGWLFADVLFADANFAFRDASHFYHPLLQAVRESWYRGEVPLWNPWENFGEPLAASPTALVFYPGSLLLLVPVPYDWAFKLFVVAHLVLAAWGAAWLARRYGKSESAATLAALAYAGSGQVLFQYCNPIYLIGAAWLPLAWAAIDRMVTTGSVRAAAALGLAMALIVLGGDPHLAYNAGLAALLLIWFKRKAVSAPAGVPGSGSHSGPYKVGRFGPPSGAYRLGLLAFAALIAAGLSAVQLLPAMRLSQRSERGIADAPRNVYELTAAAAKGDLARDGPTPWYAVLVGDPAPPEMHLGNLYDFSVGPWRLAELLWPNVGGQAFPERSRWFDVIPAERRYWTASLYLGVIPLLLALARMRFCHGTPRVRWLTWTMVLGTLASLGEYAPGWLAKEIAGNWYPAYWEAGNREFPVGNACGGLYWLMVVLLPGYAGFRYPGKWFTLVALAAALLAAGGWDSLRQPRFRRRVVRWLVVVAATSVLLALASLALRSTLLAWFATGRRQVFGPLQPEAAWFDLIFAFGQTALVCAIAAAIIARGRWLHIGTSISFARWLLLVLVTLDLAVAHRWLVVGERASLWHHEPGTAQRIREHAQDNGWDFYRVWRPRLRVPPPWLATSSPDRLAEMVQRDRATLYPHFSMPLEVRVLPFSGTFTLWDVFDVTEQMRLAPAAGIKPASLTDQWFAACGVGYMILPAGQLPPSDENWRWLDVADDAFAGADLWARREAPCRAWLAPKVITITPPAGNRPKDIERARTRVLQELAEAGGAAEVVVVESDDPAAAQLARTSAADETVSSDQGVRVLSDRPGQIEVAITTNRQSLLVVNELFDTDWKAQVLIDDGQVRDVPIYRTNRLFCGVAVPEGEYRLLLTYRPWWLYLGAVISAATLLLLIAGLWRYRMPARLSSHA